VQCSDTVGWHNVWVTNFRIIIQPVDENQSVEKILLATISSAQLAGNAKKRRETAVKIATKDFRQKILSSYFIIETLCLQIL